ncbi:MAG: TraB/GumN family protein [Proteobacteria bacterium]|nr:TraB/GumN family protein [Pseudomonadota bacterium]
MDKENNNSQTISSEKEEQSPVDAQSQTGADATVDPTDTESDSEADQEESHVTVIEDGSCVYHIVGTAHVSDKSRQEVARLIESIKPDKVCVELDQERYDSFYDTDRWKKLDIFEVIKKGKFLYLLANLAISAYQRKMGAKLGVKPGAELIGATEVAKANGAEVVLIDRNIHITLKRVWGNLGFFTKCSLLGAIVESLFEGKDESKEETSEDIENLKKDENISSMMETFAEELPEVHLPLIDERDRYLVAKMRECGGKNVIAVVGAGHVAGMQRYFHTEIDTNALEKLPRKGILIPIIKWAIPLIILGGIAYGVYTHGFESLYEMLTRWILPNSIFCFITAVLALAHPLTIIASIFVSPLTSTTPVIGAGIVLGLLEAWLRKPKVEDCEDLVNVHTLRGFYKNRFTHVLIVAVLTTFGSAAGAWIGIAWLLAFLGLN